MKFSSKTTICNNTTFFFLFAGNSQQPENNFEVFNWTKQGGLTGNHKLFSFLKKDVFFFFKVIFDTSWLQNYLKVKIEQFKKSVFFSFSTQYLPSNSVCGNFICHKRDEKNSKQVGEICRGKKFKKTILTRDNQSLNFIYF